MYAYAPFIEVAVVLGAAFALWRIWASGDDWKE